MLFSDSNLAPERFTFDSQVADVFQDMVNRSVPGYASIIQSIGLFAQLYAQPKTNLYDLGCSLGAASFAMRHAVDRKECTIFAIDNSSAMIERLTAHCKRDFGIVPIHAVCGDVEEIKIQNASVVVLNFTLQFIAPTGRLNTLKKIFNGLVPGGILIISEKISYTNQKEQEHFDTLHEAFKRANGYSELEISRKRNALDNVLIRDTKQEHIERLTKAGFQTSYEWFRCLNFISICAQK